ncbi:MAG: hypothetical protein WEB02_04285 [Methylophaga sp.]
MELLLLLFVVVALIFYLTAEPAEHLSSKPMPTDRRYRAVKIKPCENACQAAVQTSQIIFLTTRAPRLPLNACDRMVSCDCQFRHFADRRRREDRRDGYGMRDMYQQNERRAVSRIGRRQADRYNVA